MNLQLDQMSLENKVASILHLEFFSEKLTEMVEAAARDAQQSIVAPKSNPSLSIYSESPGNVNSSGLEVQLAFLISHGFTPECIYSQAGKPQV